VIGHINSSARHPSIIFCSPFDTFIRGLINTQGARMGGYDWHDGTRGSFLKFSSSARPEFLRVFEQKYRRMGGNKILCCSYFSCNRPDFFFLFFKSLFNFFSGCSRPVLCAILLAQLVGVVYRLGNM